MREGSDGGGKGPLIEPQLYDMTHAEEVIRPVRKGIAPTLNSRMGTGGNQIPVMLANPEPANTLRSREKGGGFDSHMVAIGYQESPDIAHCVRSQPSKADKPDSTTYVIQNATRGKSQNGLGISQDDVSYTLDSLGNHAVATVDCRIGYRVRRLTPLECERLQGFPDYWTDIPGASDTARYKAIGNSVAIPCVDYVLGGIAEVLEREASA